MATDLIRYDLLVQDALRSVVRKVLADTARNGLMGEHHFNIAFKTHAPGVVAPPAVKQRFPDEMSIILQHEFWDLVVTQDAFEVSLNFSRKPERLTVPFDSITGFTDPSVPFGFKLEPRVSEPARAVRRLRSSKRNQLRARPPTREASAGQAARPTGRGCEALPERGETRRARRRSEGRVDRRLPQEIAEASALSEIVNLRRARKQKNRERKEAEAAQNRAVFGRSKAEKRLIESERALAEAQLDARRLARARWRLTARTRASSSARWSLPDIAPAFRSRMRFGAGCVASRLSGVCPSIGWRRWSTPRAAAPISHRPSVCSCLRPNAPICPARAGRPAAPFGQISRACLASGSTCVGRALGLGGGVGAQQGALAPTSSLFGAGAAANGAFVVVAGRGLSA